MAYRDGYTLYPIKPPGIIDDQVKRSYRSVIPLESCQGLDVYGPKDVTVVTTISNDTVTYTVTLPDPFVCKIAKQLFEYLKSIGFSTGDYARLAVVGAGLTVVKTVNINLFTKHDLFDNSIHMNMVKNIQNFINSLVPDIILSIIRKGEPAPLPIEHPGFIYIRPVPTPPHILPIDNPVTGQPVSPPDAGQPVSPPVAGQPVTAPISEENNKTDIWKYIILAAVMLVVLLIRW